MKSLHIARGIAGAVASLLGVMAVGCSAETGDQGPEAQIGSSAEALTIDTGADAALQFYGSIKLTGIANNDTTGVEDSLELMVGGMSKSGVLSNKFQIYDAKNDKLSLLKNSGGTAITLPTALVEPVIAKIPNTTGVFMVGTGRVSRDGNPTADTYILTLTLDANKKITNAVLKKIGEGGMIDSGTPLPTALVISHKNVKQCGATAQQKLIFGGGITAAKSFQDTSAVSASKDIFVLTYNSGNNGGNSSWARLNDGATPTAHDVKLRQARGYLETFDADPSGHTVFYFAGGMTPNALAVTDNDRLVVDQNCTKATNAAQDNGVGDFKLVAATAMPDARARFASIAINSTTGGVAYEFLVGGGNNATISDGTAAPVASYQFDIDASSGLGQWRSAGNVQTDRLFPRLVGTNATPSVVKLVTGYVAHSGSEATDPYYDTPTAVDVFTASTAAWTSGTAFSSSEDRVGAFADLLNTGTTASPVLTAKVGPGTEHTNTTGNTAVSGTNDLQTVVTVP